MNLSTRYALLGYAFLIPLFLILGFVLFYPIGRAIWLSFYRKIVGSPAEFIGLGNYIEILTKEYFYICLKNTVVYTFSAVTLKALIGLIVALALNRESRYRGILRTIALIPWTIPTFVIALLYYWLFHTKLGAINIILESLGMQPVRWLTSPEWAMPSVIWVNFWRGMPFFAVTFLAGLQAIKLELYEAAEIDGAGYLQKLRHITLPGLKYVILTMVLLSTIWTFGDFALIWILTAGGPGMATTTLPIYIYNSAFSRLDIGYASALSIVTAPIFILLMVMTIRIILRGE
ncbi:sugar ABC transporter permease [Candidatus Bathyarchaeota archaeon]|nr:sugar ABC transporter permease [Candidatus Bathyarchaeota archaeon]RLE62854.1 MAG: sugar ABC transporter permease [Thermoprotei archaeon]